jgi:hypothetical protein
VPDLSTILTCMWNGKPVPRDPLVSHGVGREVHAQQDGGCRAETARDTGGDLERKAKNARRLNKKPGKVNTKGQVFKQSA